MKKFVLASVAILAVFGVARFSSPTLKAYVANYGDRGVDSVIHAWRKLVLGQPHPIYYIDEKKLKEKIDNLADWAVKQIDADLANYDKFTSADIAATCEKLDKNIQLVKVTVNAGKVKIETPKGYRDYLNEESAFTFGVKLYERVFEYAAKKGYVKNVEFLLSSEIPELPKAAPFKIAPILVAARNESVPFLNTLIMIPDWMNLNTWAKYEPRIKFASSLSPWETKIPKVLWRGGHADVYGYREKIVEYSLETKRELIDARFVEGNDLTHLMTHKEQLRYKFLLSIDGHTAAWERPVWQLYSGCVMIKQKSPLIQWYYNAIKPGVHYLEYDGSEPKEIKRIISERDDAELREISKNARDFVENNLNIEDMVAYIITLSRRLEKTYLVTD